LRSVPTLSITILQIPLREIASNKKITGISMIYRDDHQRYGGAIKFLSAAAIWQQPSGEAQDVGDASKLNCPKATPRVMWLVISSSAAGNKG